MSAWGIYTSYIRSNCNPAESKIKDLAYWRNNLFAGVIIYLLPFCLIALIPGLYVGFSSGLYILVFVDVITVISMLLVAFFPGIVLHIRKRIFITTMYIFSCLMLYYLGLAGPGLIFLQSCCILSILIFPAQYAWRPALINTFICIVFIIAVSFNVLPRNDDTHHATAEWIAITSNLVFLSFLFAALLPRLFSGLQETIQTENELRLRLSQQQASLEQAVKMLEKKNNELEQFAYVASHDLQEPLRMITGFLALLSEKYSHVIDDKGKKYIHFAVDGAQRMRQIIVDLLEFSRVGKLKENIGEVNINELVADIITLYQNQISETGAFIGFANLPVLQGYKTPLRQVFQNLLSNALKYRNLYEPPRISITVEDKTAYWQFAVKDNGIGISPEYFEKIFVIFQRLVNKVDYPGTGIGLAICKKIVENLGGTIWVESDKDKGETTFYFTLPKQ